MVLCPSCGKQTFKRKFCVFCGATIVEQPSQKVEKTTESEGKSSDREEIDIIEERLKDLHALRETFLAESERFQSDWGSLKSNLEKKISLLRKDAEDAKKKLEEATFLLSVEELTAKEYEEKSNTLNLEMENSNKVAKNLEERIRSIEDFIAGLPKNKMKKKGKKTVKTGKDKKEKLLKLEKAYKDGKLSEDVYKKLRAKYA